MGAITDIIFPKSLFWMSEKILKSREGWAKFDQSYAFFLLNAFLIILNCFLAYSISSSLATYMYDHTNLELNLMSI